VDSQQLGWGIIGLGRIAATQIAPAITAAPNSTLISVVSRDLGRATEFAKAHGAAQALDSYPAMLADPAVQAVYIATPNALHAGQVIAAAQAGKHVLCDKPLAVTVPDARRCVEECRAAGVRLGLTFQTRRHDGLAEAAELVRSGAIGKVVVAEVQMSAGRNLPGGWRTDPALAGLGTINNIGVHAFDVLRYLIGAEVTEVAAMVDAEPGFDVDTTALVLLRFSTGTLGYVNANQSVPNARDDIGCTAPRAGCWAATCPGRTGTARCTSSPRTGRASSRRRRGTPTGTRCRRSPTRSWPATTRARPARTGCAAWNSPPPSSRPSSSAGWSRSAAEPGHT
jgi:predicted dehydrogenase